MSKQFAFQAHEGKKFGRLTTTSIYGYKQGKGKAHPHFMCVCDCGNVIATDAHNLVNRHTQSCGCLRAENSAKAKRVIGAAFNSLIREYKNSPRKRGLPFDLSEQEFRNLTSGDCYYCGAPPAAVKYSTSRLESYTYNGIDRRSSTQGYVFHNCVSCCQACNYLKSDYSFDEFLEIIEKIYKRRIKGDN